MAHPAGSPHRAAKMAVVLRALQRYQCSQYDIVPLPHVANYLNSVRYIEELQKFLEDDHYKSVKGGNNWFTVGYSDRGEVSLTKVMHADTGRLSLKLEPASPAGSCGGSKESVSAAEACPAALSPSPSHRLGSGSLRLHSSYQPKFIPTHRKCRSLGSKYVYVFCRSLTVSDKI